MASGGSVDSDEDSEEDDSCFLDHDSFVMVNHDVGTDKSTDQLRMVLGVECEPSLEIGDGNESRKTDVEAMECEPNLEIGDGNESPKTDVVPMKYEPSLEIGDGNESPKTDVEDNPQCHVRSTNESSNDTTLEKSGIMSTDHAYMQSEREDGIGPFGSYNTIRSCHATEKEMRNEGACYVEDHFDRLDYIGASNAMEHHGHVCKGIVNSGKNVTFAEVCANELESNVNDGECITTFVEKGQPSNKDDGRKTARDEVEDTIAILTPLEEPSGPALDEDRYSEKKQACLEIGDGNESRKTDVEAMECEPNLEIGDGNESPKTDVKPMKCEPSLEIGDGNESPKTDVEDNPQFHVQSTNESSNDTTLEKSGIMSTDHAYMQSESEDGIGPFGSYNTIRLCHATGKEMRNKGACFVEDHSDRLDYIGASNAMEHHGDVCKGIANSEKNATFAEVCANELESKVNDGECMITFVEKGQPSNKDDGRKTARDEVEASIAILTLPEEPSGLALDEVSYSEKKQACFMIRIPKFSDDELSMKLQHSRMQLDEKTRSMDSIRVALQMKRASLHEYKEKIEAAKAEEGAARAAVYAKRQEINSVRSIITKMKNVSSIYDFDDKVCQIEHIFQHETISLPQEKQYIHAIIQLRHNCAQLSSNIGPHAIMQEVFDQRYQVEERLKTMRKELDFLRDEVFRVEGNVKVARKKYDDEFRLLKDLQAKFTVAEELHKEEYMHMQNLRKESTLKIRYFLMYKNDQQVASSYVFSKDRDGLRSYCSEQVERIMDLWNNNDEFRRQYVESNKNNTLRRLRTMDGRSLGLDEEPPIMHRNVDRRPTEALLFPISSISPCDPVLQLEMKQGNKEHTVRINTTALEQVAGPRKSITSRGGDVKATVSSNEDLNEVVEKAKLKHEEEELAMKAEELACKAEELRKEKVAAELKERCRLEQRTKAEEADERKRRKAEKAQAKAVRKAQKESELKEKKQAMKGKKKVATLVCEPTDVISLGTSKVPDSAIIAGALRWSSKPTTAVKQYKKAQPPLLPLAPRRGRCNRKMQAWMWFLLLPLLLLVLFSITQFLLSKIGF